MNRKDLEAIVWMEKEVRKTEAEVRKAFREARSLLKKKPARMSCKEWEVVAKAPHEDPRREKIILDTWESSLEEEVKRNWMRIFLWPEALLIAANLALYVALWKHLTAMTVSVTTLASLPAYAYLDRFLRKKAELKIQADLVDCRERRRKIVLVLDVMDS